MSGYEANIWVVGGGQDASTTVDAVNAAIGTEFVELVPFGITLVGSGTPLADQQCILVVANDTERVAYICDSITVTR